jgi:lipoprotein signal peptidase
VTRSALVPASPVGAREAIPAPLSARTQRVLGLLLLIAVVALDQGTKAWAWRQASVTIINSGSVMGGAVNACFSGRISGAVLDFFDAVALCAAGFVLVRIPRRPAVLVSATLVIAGWGSNLLDRLGMHSVTAPGSVRGAVDFIHVGRFHINVADLFIAGATTVLLALVAGRSRRSRSVGPRSAERTAGPGRPARRTSRRTAAWAASAAVAVAAGLAVDVSIAAVHYGRLDYSSSAEVAGAAPSR